jgi:hypothetical protein
MRAEAQSHNIYKINSWKGKGIVIKPYFRDLIIFHLKPGSN